MTRHMMKAVQSVDNGSGGGINGGEKGTERAGCCRYTKCRKIKREEDGVQEWSVSMEMVSNL